MDDPADGGAQRGGMAVSLGAVGWIHASGWTLVTAVFLTISCSSFRRHRTVDSLWAVRIRLGGHRGAQDGYGKRHSEDGAFHAVGLMAFVLIVVVGVIGLKATGKEHGGGGEGCMSEKYSMKHPKNPQ